ncbi:Topless-related protein 4 [Camellia lanceoleosa]|uniref:Topless-related protein 4 n=1 Tax=Camellia lanceoleosa TaxID=1840588 RepID=A0ACC0IYC1_9ERIC|nr:Topless-related protein 4 [Camellia lanceoleosa]
MGCHLVTICDAINPNSKCWRKDVLQGVVSPAEADKICKIPVAFEDHEDCLIWHHDPKGSYSFIFSTGIDGRIKAWLYDNLGSRTDYDAPGHSFITMAYSADGTRLFSCGTSKEGESYIVKWNKSEGAIKRTYQGLRKRGWITGNNQIASLLDLLPIFLEKCLGVSVRLLRSIESRALDASRMAFESAAKAPIIGTFCASSLAAGTNVGVADRNALAIPMITLGSKPQLSYGKDSRIPYLTSIFENIEKCQKNKENRFELKVLHTAGSKAFRKVQYDEDTNYKGFDSETRMEKSLDLLICITRHTLVRKALRMNNVND